MLDFLVSVDDPAAQALRIQAATAQVTQECECGCGGILRYAHVTSTYVDPEDPEATQWLILEVDDGWIADIEIAWVHGSTRSPKELPSPEGFSPPSKDP